MTKRNILYSILKFCVIFILCKPSDAMYIPMRPKLFNNNTRAFYFPFSDWNIANKNTHQSRNPYFAINFKPFSFCLPNWTTVYNTFCLPDLFTNFWLGIKKRKFRNVLLLFYMSYCFVLFDNVEKNKTLYYMMSKTAKTYKKIQSLSTEKDKKKGTNANLSFLTRWRRNEVTSCIINQLF